MIVPGFLHTGSMPMGAGLAAGLGLHEGEGEHVHELTLDERGRLAEHIWKLENVELTTVGIDIGSSTSHLTFSGVRLQRKTQALSSQFVVVQRKVLWKSPILLTPFVADDTIDASALADFVARCHREAGLAPEAVDTGAVILTGEAIKRRNARALADLFAEGAGNFVCASAGHHLESVLSAHGSGAVAMSRELSGPILNVDIGGGTTKLALVEAGQVLSTCAFAVGGRLIAFDGAGRITRLDASAREAARCQGVELALGEVPSPADLDRIVGALADVAVAMIRGDEPAGLGQRLLLTEPMARPRAPVALCFSGGVSEYIDGREARDFGDIARRLGERVAEGSATSAGMKRLEAHERIRATVIGASQFSVQVSGKTIHIGEGATVPLRNVPVIAPALDLDDEIDPARVARSIESSLARAPDSEDSPVAIAVRWRGEPYHRRLRALAEGIALATAPRSDVGASPWGTPAPLVLMVDADVGRTLGHILEHELSLAREVVCIDGIQLREFDFVDIGEVIRPADVVPVVIKSLLFPGADAASPLQYKPA